MLKKTITFNDLDGNPITEDFYFNLSKAEIIELQFSEAGGFKETLEKIVKEENNREIYRHFKNLILKAYGRRSEDGKRFIKSEQAAEEFTETEAFSELIMEFFQNPSYAAEFFQSLMPQSLINEVEKPASGHRPAPQDYKQKEVKVQDEPNKSRGAADHAASQETPAQIEARIRKELEERYSAERATKDADDDDQYPGI